MFEFDQKQFIVGKRLQVFPCSTDGGFQIKSRNSNTMFELFNSKYQDSLDSYNRMNPYGGGGGGPHYDH